MIFAVGDFESERGRLLLWWRERDGHDQKPTGELSISNSNSIGIWPCNRCGKNTVRPIRAVIATGGSARVISNGGGTSAQFDRIHRRLRQLGSCFETGAAVPKQRRPYRRVRAES